MVSIETRRNIGSAAERERCLYFLTQPIVIIMASLSNSQQNDLESRSACFVSAYCPCNPITISGKYTLLIKTPNNPMNIQIDVH